MSSHFPQQPGQSPKRIFQRFLLPVSVLLVYLGVFSGNSVVFAAQIEPTSTPTRPPAPQYDEFWQQETASDFKAWTLNGVSVSEDASSTLVRLAPGGNLSCLSSDVDGGLAMDNASAGLCAGVDPYVPGTYPTNRNYYNGGSFYFGTFISPEHTTQRPITTVIASWTATTPTGTWMEVHVRVQENGQWTHWYKLPIWASDLSTIQRHSIDGQSDATGDVETDTFVTAPNQTATAYQLSITLFATTPSVTPIVERVGAVASYDSSIQPMVEPDRSVWGTNLAVPERSQMLPEYQGQDYGGGGEVWCSPTSTSMVMAYWSNVLNQTNLNQSVPDAAKGAYDFTYDGTGNWPFNTAYAASFGNIHSFVTRMYSMSQIEQWIKAGVPVVISIAFKENELPGAPISSSTGHVIVVRGFDASGNVIVNDPAPLTNAEVQRVYDRTALQKVWLNSSHGTVYMIYPENWSIPTNARFTSW